MQNKLHTFESAVNVWKVKVNGKEVAFRSGKDTFTPLLIMQKTRGIQLQAVLQYELASVPLTLSDPDASSSLWKTAESELFKYLKKLIPAIAVIPFNSSKIYKGMVLFQKLPPDLVTFGDISGYRLKKFKQGSCRICFFAIDYLENSIKSLEREGRSSIGILRITVSQRNQVKPKQSQKFL